jgi:hypothetical protein
MYCRSSIFTRADNRGKIFSLALLALALLLGAPIVDARADEALAARARDVLAAHCPACREVGESTAAPDLAAIARDPTLIRPGNPDGSPAYTTLLRRFGSSGPGASADELATLRAWIESLSAEAATCPSATFLPRERIEAELARVAASRRKPTSAFRVLSLAHLDLGCAPPTLLAEWRQTLEFILGALAGTHPAPSHVLDVQGHYLAFDIQDLGWDNLKWRAVLGVKTQIRRVIGPMIVRADQLVAQVLRGEFGTALAGPNGPVPAHLADSHLMQENDREIARAILALVAPLEMIERHAELILQLARQHLAPVNLPRMAAELGMKPETLADALAPVASGERHLLRRLIYGTVLRNDIEDSWALILRLLKVTPPDRAVPLVPLDAVSPPVTVATPIDLMLYPDMPQYKAGDAIEITVRSNVDCILTIISIDTAGFGTVLFPNDLTTNNRIGAHLSATLPPQGSRYRFRLKEKGRERIVALCTRVEGLVEGIRHDFERQRFQELGPYAAFLDASLRRPPTVPESERKEGAPPPGPAIVPQNQIWRTGIVIEVQ